MDQKVVDQLSLDAIPYYKEQLYSALSALLELQNQIEEDATEDVLIVKTRDSTGDQYQFFKDVNQEDLDDIMQEVHEKCIVELDEIDQISRDQDLTLYQMHQELDELADELQANQEWTCYEEKQAQQYNNKMQEQLQMLTELQHQLADQDQNNKQTQLMIQRKQKQQVTELEFDEKVLMKQQKQQQKHLCKAKFDENVFLQVMELTQQRDLLKEDTEDFVKQQELIIQELERQLTTALSEAQINQVKSLIELSSHKSEIEIRETLDTKRRACCGQCHIF